MLPTLEWLTASSAPKGDLRPQVKPKPQRPPKQHTPPPPSADVVDLDDEGDDEPEVPLSRPKKRSRATMSEGHRVFHSSRQFKAAHTPPTQHGGGQRQSSHPAERSRHASASGVHQQPPAQPLQVTPIQARSPSPERVAILPPPTPTPQAKVDPPKAPVSPAQPSTDSEDVALRLRKDRQAFYVKAASAAQSSVTMDTPKPALRPPMTAPGLFHLMPCGLLKFNLDCGDFQAFEEEVTKWQNDPLFMDRLFAAYGRFWDPFHQVHMCLAPFHSCFISNVYTSMIQVVTCSYDFCRYCRQCHRPCGFIIFCCNMDFRAEL